MRNWWKLVDCVLLYCSLLIMGPLSPNLKPSRLLRSADLLALKSYALRHHAHSWMIGRNQFHAWTNVSSNDRR